MGIAEDAWNVDDGEVVLLGAANFNLEDILGEYCPSGIITFCDA